MRLVFDTNALLSAALLKHSIPYKAYKKGIINNHTILRTESTLKELEEVITRPKFDRYFESEQVRNEFLLSFIANSTHIELIHRIHACRDPKDNKFLELAASGNADCIVSGDNDLLILNPFRSIQIITSKDFIELF